MAPTSSDTTHADLVFIGKIKKIEQQRTGDRQRHWVVTASVDQLLSGEFAGAAFSFAIHSPTQAGLAVGAQREIRAVWTGDGYTVDERQWLPTQAE